MADRDCSVDIVTGYGLDGLDSIPGRVKRFFSSFHSVQTGSGAHSASYPMGNGTSLPGGKAVGASS
jgi:hypothetical protein